MCAYQHAPDIRRLTPPRATAILRDTTFRSKSVHVSNEIRTFHACHWPLKSSLSLLNSEYLSHRCLPIPVNCNEFHCLMLHVCVIARPPGGMFILLCRRLHDVISSKVYLVMC